MKTESNFTKGEWKILWYNYTHFATINTDSLHRICAIEVNNAKEMDEAIANAMLISAAPDMLQALNELVTAVSPYIYRQGVKKAFSELVALESAKKAIYKATNPR
jgi:hypothetical protein